MNDQKFKASLSRSQGRSSWCIIFKHPIRTGNDGRPGLRIRRGLGTSNDAEAKRLVDQMNLLLSEKSYWSATQRENAMLKFDPKIVSAFYDNLTPEILDSSQIRDEFIPMPDSGEGYIRTLLIGTTGAGKTTLVRQLIGTDPYEERFPSTSAARTTISDIEIITSDGPFEAIVTFISKERLRQYVEESITAAMLSRKNSQDNDELERKFLEHQEQRFRLSYLLGTLKSTEFNNIENELADDEDDEDISESTFSSELTSSEKESLNIRLKDYISRMRELSEQIITDTSNILNINLENADKNELETFFQLVEDEIYQSESFHLLVDDIIDDIENKFGFEKGEIHKKKD
jgi:GTPase SAR1 family protein